MGSGDVNNMRVHKSRSSNDLIYNFIKIISIRLKNGASWLMYLKTFITLALL